jgi:hypothetical protein
LSRPISAARPVWLVSFWKIRISCGFSSIKRLGGCPFFDVAIDLWASFDSVVYLRAVFDKKQWISTAPLPALDSGISNLHW